MTESSPRPLPQKTIGILGGMSDVATADYYRRINARLNAHHGGWDNAEIVLLIGQEDLPGFPVFDTTSLHVEAAVCYVLGEAGSAPAA